VEIRQKVPETSNLTNKKLGWGRRFVPLMPAMWEANSLLVVAQATLCRNRENLLKKFPK
jgi:hypothetical protein